MTTQASNDRAAQKWGDAAGAGFQAVPDILLTKQMELGLSATDLLVLINITMHWWYEDQRPFPRNTTIAKRMGIDPRTVQRSVRKMIDLGLISRETETKDSVERQVIDLTGLVERLGTFARKDPNFAIRRARRQAT